MYFKLLTLVIVTCFSLPLTSSAALPNRAKALKIEMKKCESQVKQYVSLGYPEKAEKQFKQCKKIKDQMAKLKASQDKIERKLASLSDKGSEKHSAKGPVAKKK